MKKAVHEHGLTFHEPEFGSGVFDSILDRVCGLLDVSTDAADCIGACRERHGADDQGHWCKPGQFHVRVLPRSLISPTKNEFWAKWFHDATPHGCSSPS